MKWVLVILVCAVAGFAAWVRLAPLPEARMVAEPGPDAPGRHRGEGDYKVVIPLANLPEGARERLEAEIARTPRARPKGEGAWVVRSALWGFPDIVRLWQADGALHLHSGLVIGKSDMGVNAKRVDGWLERAGIGE
ncbi:DUF1499 domain-containing protein [Vannielia sp.]|uniref:DUF1499 domain-containing protein n=1 Tax=Vannielia sp. TaxID=2813045 RepID=UPI00262D7741|nr:DUF1499 domain-containing protein [Vannielia sp.]MDF1873760.1 DUF1499 domain-containing protein [Vannielia sp.]